MSEVNLNAPTRKDVIDAWKAVSIQGFEDPAEISESITGHPETDAMVTAGQLFDIWYQSESSQQKSPEELLRFQFETTILFVEAGFVGSDYLDEVANDWLRQDLEAAETQGFTDLATRIQEQINEINNRRIK